MSEVEKPEEINNLKENDACNESKCLLILNLQRPFISQNLETLLNKYGKVQRFWLDFIKTHCYVEYSSFEEAKLAKENLDDIKWPSEGKNLKVNYVSNSELNETLEKNKSNIDKDKLNSQNEGLRPEEQIIIINSENKLTQSFQVEEEPEKTLDSLFKKTFTKPHIYYLPLTEEEVEEKRNKIKKKE